MNFALLALLITQNCFIRIVSASAEVKLRNWRPCRFKEPTLLTVQLSLNTRFRCWQKVQILCADTGADADVTIGAVLMPMLVLFKGAGSSA